jgi:hypothetical protein
MKIYPFPVRFYLHAGTALGAGLVESHGGGIGYDIHVLKSRRLIWQPQIGYQYIWVALSGDGIEPSASLSLSYAFGRSPAWVK